MTVERIPDNTPEECVELREPGHILCLRRVSGYDYDEHPVGDQDIVRIPTAELPADIVSALRDGDRVDVKDTTDTEEFEDSIDACERVKEEVEKLVAAPREESDMYGEPVAVQFDGDELYEVYPGEDDGLLFVVRYELNHRTG